MVEMRRATVGRTIDIVGGRHVSEAIHSPLIHRLRIHATEDQAGSWALSSTVEGLENIVLSQVMYLQTCLRPTHMHTDREFLRGLMIAN
jgi:hypothetical protein